MILDTKIIAHNNVAEGTHEVTLARPSEFSFSAGQHIQIKLPSLVKSDPKGLTRLFSIASSPDELGYIRIVFRKSDSGFKETLTSLPVGSPIIVEQASGNFILPHQPKRPHIFVAGGVGISPFMSYLHQNISESWTYPIVLYYGNQNPESAAYLTELKQMTKLQNNFVFNEIYKKPTSNLFAKLTGKHLDAMWWVVGPPAMVSTTVYGLKSGGVSTQDIITESFEGY